MVLQICALNHDHVLEIFCGFSGFEASDLWNCALTIMNDQSEWAQWSHTGSLVTQMNFVPFDQWIKNMKNLNTPCDEPMIHALSRIHCRHSVIIRSSRTWSTVDQQDAMLTMDELRGICDVRLAFLGDRTFGELRCLPMCAPPPNILPLLPIIKTSHKPATGTTRWQRKPLNLSMASLTKKSTTQSRKKATSSHPIEIYSNSLLKSGNTPSVAEDSIPAQKRSATTSTDNSCFNSSKHSLEASSINTRLVNSDSICSSPTTELTHHVPGENLGSNHLNNEGNPPSPSIQDVTVSESVCFQPFVH